MSKDALLDSRTPSTSTAVPKEALPLSPDPPARRVNCFWLVRVLFSVTPPGSRLAMSLTFISWTWSRAVLSMVRDVVAAAWFSSGLASRLTPTALLVWKKSWSSYGTPSSWQISNDGSGKPPEDNCYR